MQSRAMIVVAAGSSSRFGGDKLWSEVAGRPLLAHTLDSMAPHVEQCVVVARSDKAGDVRRLRTDVSVVQGGETRTESEIAGLAAVDQHIQLIGIHDGARPLATSGLVESLFAAAQEDGGAVPVLTGGPPLLERSTLEIARDVLRAQTPQVFRGDVLRDAYESARRDEFSGLDTADVVIRYTDCRVRAVPGESFNVKVTYPSDLEVVTTRLRGTSRT